MSKYFLNLETSKIELHFSKSEYLALTDSQKSEIKSTFLWSGKSGGWVSRSTNNHWRAEDIAKKLGLEDGGKIGERLSYSEQLEVKAEKAEARADRFETYSDNAEKRAVSLQSDFNKYRKDWSWLTQPIIAGHSGSQAFGNHKAKVMARYDRGMDEYKKSEYYQDRAATARATADNVKLKDRVYIDKKIKECNKTLKIYQEHIVRYEDALYKVCQGEKITSRSGELLTEDYIEQRIADRLEKYEWEHDKLDFFENCLSDLGGIAFSKDNIKVGYIVKMKRWGKCEVMAAGPVNVTYKILEGGAAGLGGVEPYAAIVEIVAEIEAPKLVNPFKTDDILCHFSMSGSRIIKAFQVIKTTETGVKIQQITVENNVPIPGSFTEAKSMQKKVVKSKFSDFVGVYDGDWQLNKYEAMAKAGAV